MEEDDGGGICESVDVDPQILLPRSESVTFGLLNHKPCQEAAKPTH